MNTIEFGDCVEIMRKWANDGIKAQMCVTSPPYFGLRDYGVDGQIGLEQTPEEYIAALVDVFSAVRDVLADDGTLWVNIGDSYAGSRKGQSKDGENDPKRQKTKGMVLDNVKYQKTAYKSKDLIGIPWMLAFALRADGWFLRQDIIWHKPNAMPESVRDRCTKAHEYIFLLSKSKKYFFDSDGIKERALTSGKQNSFSRKSNTCPSPCSPMQHRDNRPFIEYSETRNRRSVWHVSTKPYKGAHFSTFPTGLIEPCILAGSRIGDVVLDPFMGSGTTAQVALQFGRKYLGCEINANYADLQQNRIDIIKKVNIETSHP